METSDTPSEHALIIAVVNLGFAEAVMSAANGVAPCGGSVIHARRAGLDKDKTFFGISIETEKEIIAILAPIDSKLQIMQAIGRNCGIATDARGIVFSLPADELTRGDVLGK